MDVCGFNSDSWRQLMRLREMAAELQSSNKASRHFLLTAAGLDIDLVSRLRRRAEEARFILNQVQDPMAQLLLQELADTYERLGDKPQELPSGRERGEAYGMEKSDIKN